MTDLFPTLLAATGAARAGLGTSTASTSGPSGPARPRPAERTLFWEWRAEGSNQLAAMRRPTEAGEHRRRPIPNCSISGPTPPNDAMSSLSIPSSHANLKQS